MPQATILAGPNGAGKSTSKPGLIDSSVTFLNADNIAREMESVADVRRDFAAGRQLLSQMAELEAQRADFAIETNLANHTLALRIPRWQAAGYHVQLIFVWLPGADLAVARVSQRVATGGHHIPEATIRRRYVVGLQNLFQVYMPIVDSWDILDNSRVEGSGDKRIERAMQQAVRERLQEHKAHGESIVVWRDSKVTWLTADEIDLPPWPEEPLRTPVPPHPTNRL